VYFLGNKDGRCVGLTTLPPLCADCLESGSLNLLEPSGPVEGCNGTDLHFFYSRVATDVRRCIFSSDVGWSIMSVYKFFVVGSHWLPCLWMPASTFSGSISKGVGSLAQKNPRKHFIWTSLIYSSFLIYALSVFLREWE